MSIGHIEFAGVWKKFRYGELHNRLRDFIPALAARATGLSRGAGRPPQDGLPEGEFWALRNVSFEVRPGQALGIIGPNGAGKSTVLKLLTRIFRPTFGHCGASGRIGALIDVSAGFHPDLTGRENIFLQGAIMGMPKREIVSKFDEIVEFSGIPWFIDTPVKRYSSGMQARLGFAIAAHLDPDVLIIDEALAVGDAAFQRKAIDRVTELVRSEIPVVVVSHQLDTISSLCTQALLLNRGGVQHSGTPRECIAIYLRGIAEEDAPAAGQAAARIESMRQVDDIPVTSGGELRVELRGSIRDGGWPAVESVSLRVRSALTGEVIFETSTLRLGLSLPESGRFSVEAELQMNVPPGMYTLESFVWDRMMERESFAGPRISVEVRGGEEFAGTVQMNPRMRLTADAPAASEA
ncbi:MAG: ABC transporter ATP-binding protein [Gemmatimonadaceae bacterium]|nr:ABC transporter ATP-binding protein [Gemmatimonadaceae bacterium]MDQ3518447.1 ABC transporter ATP-binding protein [Gemmatimonadota bacterium]